MAFAQIYPAFSHVLVAFMPCCSRTLCERWKASQPIHVRKCLFSRVLRDFNCSGTFLPLKNKVSGLIFWRSVLPPYSLLAYPFGQCGGKTGPVDTFFRRTSEKVPEQLKSIVTREIRHVSLVHAATHAHFNNITREKHGREATRP